MKIFCLVFLFCLALYGSAGAATYGNTGTGTATDGTDEYFVCYNAGVFGGTNNSTIASGSWRGARFSGSGSVTIWLGLYSTTGTTAGTRLAMISSAITLTTTVTTFTIVGTDSFALQNGTTYWICASSSLGSGWQNRKTAQVTDSSYNGTGSTGALPATWTETAAWNQDISAYFNLSDPAGAAVVPKLTLLGVGP